MPRRTRYLPVNLLVPRVLVPLLNLSVTDAAERAEFRRKNSIVRKTRIQDDQHESDREYWSHKSVDERLAMTHSLFL